MSLEQNVLTDFHDYFIHIQHIIQTNILTKKNAPPPGGHVFQETGTIFELFHDDRTINMASRVLTRKMPRPLGGHAKFHDDRTITVVSNVLIRKNAPLPGGLILKLVQDIIEFNLLTKFHEDQTKMWSLEKCPTHWHVFFQANANLLTEFHDDWTINVTSRVLTRMNLLTKFHGDRTINVASRVLTRENSPLLGSHTNVLTKFHEERTINMASRVLTR
ncbi:hypothetical protein DPMN_182543 [Dreissena polymorpha]|uniref:Uncharacterized protein n=1 Tax=Dreissena polymorpha TaxID=45954 RepID=A0A9D4I2Q2_DREPO|nr:hypothetical protein DPMN_182543 [Dreissena polymorpha]